MDVYEALAIVQAELKAPKGQYNLFGKYSYRSCEDIIEAVKPILQAYGLVLTINDDIVLIGDRYYVKATASVISTDTEYDETAITVSAFAREAETKTGMDAAQITGSASSYARKYALNGLFAIDDTKDPDATNTGSEPKQEKKRAAGKKTEAAVPTCADCGAVIKGVGEYSAQEVADLNQRRYGRQLCAACSTKAKSKGEGTK